MGGREGGREGDGGGSLRRGRLTERRERERGREGERERGREGERAARMVKQRGAATRMGVLKTHKHQGESKRMYTRECARTRDSASTRVRGPLQV